MGQALSIQDVGAALIALGQQLIGATSDPVPAAHAEGPVGPTLQAYRGPQDDPGAAYAPDGATFARDYWVVGRMGAMRGARTDYYAIASMMQAMMGGTDPRHNEVMTALPAANWNGAQKRASEIGWAAPEPDHVPDPMWQEIYRNR